MSKQRDETGSQPLLDDERLEQSCVVANNRMNRERNALGTNGYEVELGFDPIQFLIERHQTNGTASWLDLCCGRGRALIEAGAVIRSAGRASGTRITGIDLVDMFDAVPDDLAIVDLKVASLHDWNTENQFDLITCVHGLHYIGDKLGLITRASMWARAEGVFYANLDLANLRSVTGQEFATAFADAGMSYDPQKHLLQFRRDELKQTSRIFSWQYLGANDQAGPNYTGQEAVCSVYR